MTPQPADPPSRPDLRTVLGRPLATGLAGYLAVGLWHRWLITSDEQLVGELWPVVRRGLDLVVAMQLDGGAIGWALRDAARRHPDWVRAVAARHPLSPLSRREALKHIGIG